MFLSHRPGDDQFNGLLFSLKGVCFKLPDFAVKCLCGFFSGFLRFFLRFFCNLQRLLTGFVQDFLFQGRCFLSGFFYDLSVLFPSSAHDFICPFLCLPDFPDCLLDHIDPPPFLSVFRCLCNNAQSSECSFCTLNILPSYFFQ